MPRRFFRKLAFKRHKVSQQWYLGPFRHLLHNPAYWAIRRRTIVPAVALGVFIAFLPLPIHTLSAVLLALLLRINIPASIIGTLVNNPLTMVPIFLGAYRLGVQILGTQPRTFQPELSIQWLTHGFLHVWQPLLLGCVLLAASASLIAYVGLDLLWRASLADYLATRRGRKPSD
jgi:uncharacterized protein